MKAKLPGPAASHYTEKLRFLSPTGTPSWNLSKSIPSTRLQLSEPRQIAGNGCHLFPTTADPGHSELLSVTAHSDDSLTGTKDARHDQVYQNEPRDSSPA